MTAAKRWILVLALTASACGPAAAADIRWRAGGELLAVYTDNVYFESKESQTPAISTGGASAGGGFGLTSSTPRSEFDIGWKGSYRNFPQETNANNLEQYLVVSWTTMVTQRTSFNFFENASSSPEVDNYEDRAIDQGLTVGTRARQFRNVTGIGMTTQMSPRWSFRADYAYRLLNNGEIQRPEDAPPATAECNGGFCIPGGTPGAPEPTIENLNLLDERGHTANVGITRQLSIASDLTLSATYLHNTTTDDVFGGSTIRKSHSYGGNVVYAWWREKTGGEAPAEPTGPVDMQTLPGAPPPVPATPEEEAAAPRRPGDDQPIAPLSAGSDGRPHGGIQAARVAARRAGGVRSGRFFELPTDELNIWCGVGAYRTTDTLGKQLEELVPATDASETTTEFAGEVGLIRTYKRGALSAGLTHGVSTFEGLGRRATIDTDGDGTLDTEVSVPAGSAIRTTLYGSYVLTLTRASHFAFSLNLTQRTGISQRDFQDEADVDETKVRAIGAGIGYDLQFADWGGIRVSYRYTTQDAPGNQPLSDLDYSKNTATLGMFFTTR